MYITRIDSMEDMDAWMASDEGLAFRLDALADVPEAVHLQNALSVMAIVEHAFENEYAFVMQGTRNVDPRQFAKDGVNESLGRYRRAREGE